MIECNASRPRGCGRSRRQCTTVLHEARRAVFEKERRTAGSLWGEGERRVKTQARSHATPGLGLGLWSEMFRGGEGRTKHGDPPGGVLVWHRIFAPDDHPLLLKTRPGEDLGAPSCKHTVQSRATALKFGRDAYRGEEATRTDAPFARFPSFYPLFDSPSAGTAHPTRPGCCKLRREANIRCNRREEERSLY